MSCDPCRRTLKKKVMKNGLSGLAGKKTMKKKMNLWMRPSMRRLCTSCLALLAVCFVHASNMCKHIYTYICTIRRKRSRARLMMSQNLNQMMWRSSALLGWTSTPPKNMLMLLLAIEAAFKPPEPPHPPPPKRMPAQDPQLLSVAGKLICKPPPPAPLGSSDSSANST